MPPSLLLNPHTVDPTTQPANPPIPLLSPPCRQFDPNIDPPRLPAHFVVDLAFPAQAAIDLVRPFPFHYRSLSLLLCFFVFLLTVDLASSFLFFSIWVVRKWRNILNEANILAMFVSMFVFLILCLCWNLGLCSWIYAIVYMILCLFLSLGLCS